MARAMETASTAPAISYEQPVSPFAAPGAAHESTAVAAGNGIYLVVWMEYANGPPDIFGMRFRASDGQPLDSSPLRIGTGSTVQYQPAVAFDGTNFLVVWEDIRSAPSIYGARVRASDGVVLDPSPIFISGRTPMGGYNLPEQAPAVAFDGTNYLVTWHGYYFEKGVYPGVMAIRVRPSDGSLVEDSTFFVAQGGTNTRVAYTNGYYLVTWTRSQVVEATRLSAATGRLLDPTITSLGPTPTQAASAVAGQGGEFLVTWVGADGTLRARRVRASDGARLDSADTVVGPAIPASPEVVFDGADYRILWQGARDGARKVLTTRVSSQGVISADAESALAEVIGSVGLFRGGIASVAPGSFLTSYTNHDAASGYNRAQARLVTGSPSFVSSEIPVSASEPSSVTHTSSAVAVGNGIYLQVWSESNSSTSNKLDVLGVRVRASDGVRLDATPLRIASTTNDEFEPAVAFDGSNFLVVWVQMGSTSPLINGARVRASDGAVLDSTPFLISRMPDARNSGLPQFEPAVAFDGTNYLVVWEGSYFADANSNVPVQGVQGIRVRPDGTLVDPSRFVIGPGGAAPQVAYADGNYLVTWPTAAFPTPSVEAARVSAATGQVLDTPAIPLGSGATDSTIGALAPAVASQGGEFLVTWIDTSRALKARRVRSSDGARLDSADIAVASYAWNYPAVTFDGSDYRIAWYDLSNGRRVLSQRVSPQGVLASDAALVISRLHSSAPVQRGGVAAADRGQFLVSYTNYDASLSANRVRMRLVSDMQTPAPQPCTSGVPTLVLNGGSPLTLECGSGPYHDPGAQAFDGCGNPIQVHAYNTGADSSGPGPNMSYEGSYSVSYAAWDAMGNTVSAIRTVNVDDRTAPTLALKGDAHMTHTCGSQWVDPGVTATDACYGNLSPQVWHTGEVNGWAVGTYTVTYSLTDSGGNSAMPVTRTVDVVNCPW